MDQLTKIAIIGGTGKSGKYLVKQLISEGFQLKLLVRDPAKVPYKSPQVETIKGNVATFQDVYNLIFGAGAVISTLGLGIPVSEPTIFSTATHNIIRAMRELNVHRYIVTTGLNVDTPFDNKSIHTAAKTEWMKSNFPLSTADKQKEYELLAASNIDWTMVRLPVIEQTDQVVPVTTSLEDCPGEQISAASLAIFLISQITDREFIRKAPFIANA
ncbi:epimerase [Paraflavitalea soli]|uniref:Epimerase n=1 Tax=Paraflavitalea soli TaxID=2315862 RepID=A0A3B7MHA2_9BACT|nr:NAD(P)H-binding protein [Paraflavitalea soli]AXY72466.1 epimerase [Paraflavitalea soli]